MVYVDTSVIVPLLTLEPSSERVLAWFSRLDEKPHSSDWLLTEFSSAIAIKVRMRQLSPAHAAAVRKEFRLLVSSGLRLAPLSRTAFSNASDLIQASEHGLRAGDALHLAVAQELEAQEVATLDTVMEKHVRRLNMTSVKF